MAHFLSDAATATGPLGLRVERTGAWIVTRLELATDSRTRRRGLLDRAGLAPGEGLMIAPTQGIHTFGMRFPIDVVGVARDGRVVTVRAAVPARRLVFAWSAFAILELPAGAAASADIRVGDQLRLLQVD